MTKRERVAKIFKNLREENGFTSSLQPAKELNMGQDTIFKIESGKSLPSKRTRLALYKLYKANKEEIDMIEKLIVKIKKGEK